MNFKDIPLIVLGEISPISTNMIAPNTPQSKYSKLAKSVVNDTSFLPQKSWSIIDNPEKWSSFAACVDFPLAKKQKDETIHPVGDEQWQRLYPTNSLEQPADEVAWSTGEILLVNYQSSRMHKIIYIYIFIYLYLCIIFKVLIDGVYIYLLLTCISIYIYMYINICIYI